ncbi:alpha/beta hydrolase-fold protein [Mucilaginibacter sp. RS28]|uniref:Alpha/beta hydrolase-fold protein n=1 Tax=Mucilaginibacter straminoryzae TaxID=2932774 RepID=A0A9X1X0L7_9SPHI|nr:alpha/beta hydrolase-fold protein [Mucilaginibacter straminoryzae]MCJ8209047.1 alpha/beta hydrolase-fold protein [Mucilaginibacter straminoryzae]
MNRVYHKWFSTELRRNMELLVFGHAGRAVLFFPTRMARFYDYENWRIVEAVKGKLEAGELQLFCVDSIDAESFYNQQITPIERIKRHLQYEKYILNEVLPLIKKENKGDFIEVAGCSMGAYHAVNIALKHPGLFKKVVGMSGRYDLTTAFTDFKDLFDGFKNEDVYYNMPEEFIANLTDERILSQIRKMDITLVVGETDPFIASNRNLSDLLHRKNIVHQLYVWDGDAHRARYWRQMVQLYL